MASTNEIYVSVDVESDGPIPGVYSMLSLGAAAFKLVPTNEDKDGWDQVGDVFDVNLLQLPDAIEDPGTMKWWNTQPEAYSATQKDQLPAKEAMEKFRDWLLGLSTKKDTLVFLGYPVTFDFMFVYWHYVKFVGFPAPFGFRALDMRTLGMDRLNVGYHEFSKEMCPKDWFREAPEAESHLASQDALFQGAWCMNMLMDERRAQYTPLPGTSEGK